MLSIRSKTYNLIKSVKFFKENVNEKSNSIVVRFEQKVKGTIIENWLKYWKTVYNDYRDVAIDVAQDIRKKPSKAILIGSGFGIAAYCSKHTPGEKHFRSVFLKACNDVILVDPSLQRAETVNHLHFIEQNYNVNKLRHLNLGLFSIIWVDNYSASCYIYEAKCSYLQLQYTTFVDRIVDVGFLDTWWILAKKMTDYDINY